MDELKEKALEYHNLNNKPGKIEVVSTKPCMTAEDLSLAYTPGVAKPVLEIADNPEDAATEHRDTHRADLSRASGHARARSRRDRQPVLTGRVSAGCLHGRLFRVQVLRAAF